MHRTLIPKTFLKNLPNFRSIPTSSIATYQTLASLDDQDDPHYADIPRPPKNKSERKPYPTPMKILIRRAKEMRESRKAEPCKMLEQAPENGLLVQELVEVAHRVFRAREALLHGLSKLVNVAVPVKRCR